MARVEIGEIVLTPLTVGGVGNVAGLAPGQTVTIYRRGTTDRATWYTSETGGVGSTADIVTDAAGRIGGPSSELWIEEDSYDVWVGGVLYLRYEPTRSARYTRTAITTVSGSPQQVIPAHSPAFRVDDDGAAHFAKNEQLVANWQGTTQNQSIPDCLWDPYLLKFMTRTVVIGELGDTPEVFLRRAGPDNGYPFATPKGIKVDATLGLVHFTGWTTPSARLDGEQLLSGATLLLKNQQPSLSRWPTTGEVLVYDTTGVQRTIAYTGIAGNSLTGCTGGSGTGANGVKVRGNPELGDVPAEGMSGGSFQVRSAQLAAKASEHIFDQAAGGRLVFYTTPVGTRAELNGVHNFPQATINLQNPTPAMVGWQPEGAVEIHTDAGVQTITFTGITGNSLTGCLGGTGTGANGAEVRLAGTQTLERVTISDGGHLLVGDTVNNGTRLRVKQNRNAPISQWLAAAGQTAKVWELYDGAAALKADMTIEGAWRFFGTSGKIEYSGLTDLAQTILGARKAGDSTDAFQLRGDGQMKFGPGTGAIDTLLYRSGAATLKTDGKLIVVGETEIDGNLNHDGAAVGFNNVAPVGKRTLGAAATDAATTQTLANNLRQAMIDVGLGQT